MGYNNGYNNGYQNAGYQNRGYQNGGYQNGGYQNGGQRQYKKRNGSRSGVFSKGKRQGQPYLYGWRKERGGFFKLMAWPDPKGQTGETKNGRQWERWLCEVKNVTSGHKQLISGFYFHDRGVFHSQEHNWMIKKANYCGHYPDHIDTRKPRNRSY